MVIRKKIVGKSHRKIPTSDIEATYNDSTAGIPTVLLFVLKPIVQKEKNAESYLINKQLQRRPQSAGGTQLTPTKNGKSRVLRPARYVMQTLKQRYTEQVMQCMRAGSDWQAWHNEAEHKKALVFTNKDGRYLVAKRLYLHFKKLAEEAGAPDARVHDLRHTFAVISLQNGDDVKTVQTNLGHASASFTLDVYGHVSDRMQRESADRMQQYINEISRTKNA